MSADERAIRVSQLADRLAAAGQDVAVLVRDAYAEGYRDGLEAGADPDVEVIDTLAGERAAVHSGHDEHASIFDIASRRPTRV